MSIRYLYLVRHGQYDLESQAELGGGLTGIGREQAEATAAALSVLPIRTVYTSPTQRTRETAVILCHRLANVQPQIVPELVEFIPSVPEQDAQFFAIHRPALTQEHILNTRMVADSAFNRLFCLPGAADDFPHEVLVCHGNIIRYFVCMTLGVPVDTWTSMETNQCGITRCAIEQDGRMRLISMNDTGHLPLALRLFS